MSRSTEDGDGAKEWRWDMIKPDQYDMQPGTFHNWNELFVSWMMSIDRKWELISTTLQRKDTAFFTRTRLLHPGRVEDFSGEKSVANHVLYVNILVHSNRSSYLKFDQAVVRDVQIYQKGKNAANMNFVLKKADVLKSQEDRHGG